MKNYTFNLLNVNVYTKRNIKITCLGKICKTSVYTKIYTGLNKIHRELKDHPSFTKLEKICSK